MLGRPDLEDTTKHTMWATPTSCLKQNTHTHTYVEVQATRAYDDPIRVQFHQLIIVHGIGGTRTLAIPVLMHHDVNTAAHGVQLESSRLDMSSGLHTYMACGLRIRGLGPC